MTATGGLLMPEQKRAFFAPLRVKEKGRTMVSPGLFGVLELSPFGLLLYRSSTAAKGIGQLSAKAAGR